MCCLSTFEHQRRRSLSRWREQISIDMTNLSKRKPDNNYSPALYNLGIFRERYTNFRHTPKCEKIAKLCDA